LLAAHGKVHILLPPPPDPSWGQVCKLVHDGHGRTATWYDAPSSAASDVFWDGFWDGVLDEMLRRVRAAKAAKEGRRKLDDGGAG
jgi:hypothetical protein